MGSMVKLGRFSSPCATCDAGDHCSTAACPTLEALDVLDDGELREHKRRHTRSNSWWLKDIRGIEVSRVCDACIASVKRGYDPAIFGERPGVTYEEMVDETIEPDGEW